MHTVGRTPLHDGSAQLCYLNCVIYKQTQQIIFSLGKVVIVNGQRTENPRNYASFICTQFFCYQNGPDCLQPKQRTFPGCKATKALRWPFMYT